MQLLVTARHVPMTDSLRDHIERRLHFALARMCPRVKQVSVRVGDVNGPRGGEDKLCTVDVRLQDAAPVRIEQLGPELSVAISRAADRVAATVRRRLQRKHRRNGNAEAA